MKQICNNPKVGSVTFGWKTIECEQISGALLGYEVKLYYDEETCTEKVPKSVNMYTISPRSKHNFSLPKAISIAAVNELGVGAHSPPVKINPSG